MTTGHTDFPLAPARRLLDFLATFVTEGADALPTLRAAEDFTPQDAFLLARLCGALDRYFLAVHRAEQRRAAGERSIASAFEADAAGVFRELSLLLADPDAAGSDLAPCEDPATCIRRFLVVFGIDPREALSTLVATEGVRRDDLLALQHLFEEVARYLGAAYSLLAAHHAHQRETAESARRASLTRIDRILLHPPTAL